MFGRYIQALKDFFVAPPIRTQFEEMMLQEAVEKKNTATEVKADKPVTVPVEPVHGKHSKPVDSQITDAVTAKPKKVRKAKDAESVSAVSEAPAKKPRAPRKKKVD